MNVKIIARSTRIKWGYRKGDVLEITAYGDNGLITAKNLTVPDCYGRKYAILHSSEYKHVAADHPTVVYEYRLLGIPVWRKYLRK